MPRVSEPIIQAKRKATVFTVAFFALPDEVRRDALLPVSYTHLDVYKRQGVLTSIRSPKDAFDNHIGMIHQHYKLVDVFTAAENIVLGLDEPGKLDIKAANARVKEICDRYGFDIDPTKKIYDMSVSQKQTVEIVKVLYRGADTLILDEMCIRDRLRAGGGLRRYVLAVHRQRILQGSRGRARPDRVRHLH